MALIEIFCFINKLVNSIFIVLNSIAHLVSTALEVTSYSLRSSDLGEITRLKFDFDVVGHYSRPDILTLSVNDHPLNPVSFASTDRSDG